MTNYNDAAVMRLLVERPTVFATEIPRSIEDGRGGGGTTKGTEGGEREDQRRPVECVVNLFPRFRRSGETAFIYESRAPRNFESRSRLPYASESRVFRLSLTQLSAIRTQPSRSSRDRS